MGLGVSDKKRRTWNHWMYDMERVYGSKICVEHCSKNWYSMGVMGGSCLHKGHGLVAICVFKNPFWRHIFSFSSVWWVYKTVPNSRRQDCIGSVWFQHEPLIIRALAQWYACDNCISDIESRKKGRFDQPVRDIFCVWHIFYSIHSSKEELEWALQLLAPMWVISTTPSCKALELDYVKRLFNQHRNFNDPF